MGLKVPFNSPELDSLALLGIKLLSPTFDPVNLTAQSIRRS